MAAVTERIDQIEQPNGGYLPLSVFQRIQLDDGATLNAKENIGGPLMGTVIDYMTRLTICGKTIGEVFSEVALRGAMYAEEFYVFSHGYYGIERAGEVFFKLLRCVKAFRDDQSIVNICRIATFDIWYRNPRAAKHSKGWESVNPDSDTILNIRTMTARSISFFREQGGITAEGFTFEPGGYTSTVDKWDGDFLTADTLWDMKVYRPSTKITKKETLQILMYWIMGQHSGQEIFKGVTKIGFFNPRMNTAYVLDVSEISAEIIREVEDKVICY